MFPLCWYVLCTISLPEDGQLRPKRVGVFKKLVLTKVIVSKFLKF